MRSECCDGQLGRQTLRAVIDHQPRMVVRVVENADGVADGRIGAHLRVRLFDLGAEGGLVVGSDLKRQRPVDVRARRLLSSVIAVGDREFALLRRRDLGRRGLAPALAELLLESFSAA